MLNQPISCNGNIITLQLHHPVQETLLNEIRTDLLAFLRQELHNDAIQLQNELKSEGVKKVVYTNREKFDHLVEKNPALRTLKDRLGLDPDF